MSLAVDKVINQWNWGAFLLEPIWSIGNKVRFGIIAWIPTITIFATIIIQVFFFAPLFYGSFVMENVYYFGFPVFYFGILFALGLKGNKWAWEIGGWSSIEEFTKSQRKWFWPGVVIFIPLHIMTFMITYSLIYWSVHIFDAC
jgi:hypothetical protein